MKLILRLLLTLSFMSMLIASATAEPLVAGQRYQGKKTLEVAVHSISFELPTGFTGVLPPGTEWFHIGKDEQVGRVFVWASQVSEAQVRATMSQGFTAAGAVMLTPTGALRTEGTALVGDYDATDGVTNYRSQVRTRTNGGIAVAVVAVAPTESFDRYQKLAVQIEKSLKFGVKPTVAKSQNSGGGQWASTLAGRRVAKYHTRSGATGGYSEKTQFDLCADGTFYRNFRASSVSGIGDGVSSNRAGGTWSVEGSQLTLRWSDGEVSQHALEDRGGQLFVDGERWLLAGTAICQ